MQVTGGCKAPPAAASPFTETGVGDACLPQVPVRQGRAVLAWQYTRKGLALGTVLGWRGLFLPAGKGCSPKQTWQTAIKGFSHLHWDAFFSLR